MHYVEIVLLLQKAKRKLHIFNDKNNKEYTNAISTSFTSKATSIKEISSLQLLMPHLGYNMLHPSSLLHFKIYPTH